MVQRRQIIVAVVAVVVSLGGRPFVPETHVAAETIPSRLSDRAFWQLVTELSESHLERRHGPTTFSPTKTRFRASSQS